jgi:hypothetical protein
MKLHHTLLLTSIPILCLAAAGSAQPPQTPKAVQATVSGAILPLLARVRELATLQRESNQVAELAGPGDQIRLRRSDVWRGQGGEQKSGQDGRPADGLKDAPRSALANPLSTRDLPGYLSCHLL